MMKLLVLSICLLLLPAIASAENCNNCADCNEKIQNATYGDIISLTADIINPVDNCIDFNGTDGITFDCSGHKIRRDGYASKTGIKLADNSDDNSIKNCEITGFFYCITIDDSQNNSITDTVCKDNTVYSISLYEADNNYMENVTVSNCSHGLRLRYSDNNILNNITAEKIGTTWDGGIDLVYSNYNNLTNPILSDNSGYGININWNSNDNIIRNATIITKEHQGGLYVYSRTGQSTKNDIDTSNTINGKPIQFFDNHYKSCPNNEVLNYGDTVSLVHLHGCNNVTLYATEMEDSVLLWSTHNSKIYNVNSSYNREGMSVQQSSSNIFENITTSSNKYTGFYMRNSYNNDITDLTASNNGGSGFSLNSCSSNQFTDTAADQNYNGGFYVSHSSYNTFDNVTAVSNEYYGIGFYWNSDYNTIKNSLIENNINSGLRLYGGSITDPEYNTIYNNMINNTLNMIVNEGILNPNYLNTSLNCSGSANIIEGQCIGGNFWATPTGTGYSETCIDIIAPLGICDEIYDLSTGTSIVIDWLPLAGNNTQENNNVCISCEDCNDKIAAANDTVRLITDIAGIEGTCIIIGDNKKFSCGGYSITGNNSGYGIWLNGSGNTIENCPDISMFSEGIRIENGNDNTLNNIKITGGTDGIVIAGTAENNTVKDCIIENSAGYGIYLEASGESYPTENIFYNNHLNNSDNLHSDNINSINHLNTTLNCSPEKTNMIDRMCMGGNYWTNPSGTGYSQTCTDSDQNGFCDSAYTVQANSTDYLPLAVSNIKDCTGCADCSEKIASSNNGDIIRLMSDIINQDNTCITIPKSGITFDCQNNKIDGNKVTNTAGIHIDASNYGDIDNITVQNCEITQFYYGINLDGSSSNRIEYSSIINITATDNDIYGMDLSYSSNNNVTDCRFNSNYNDGIMVWDSDSNRLENIETHSNGQCGIYLIFSSSNILTGITTHSNSYAGIYIDRSPFTTVTDSYIKNNNIIGINMGADGNTIYNNHFNNAENIWAGAASQNNAWDTSKTSGTSIAGGPYLGGNFWENAEGTGFSEICNDTDADYICDEYYNISSGNIDYLPLIKKSRPPGTIYVNISGWWINVTQFNASATPIQSAVDNAVTGDIIIVKDGNYTENILIETRLEIRSENGAGNCIVTAASPSSHVFEIAKSRVNISGFTVKGATDDKAGIYLNEGVKNANILNNNCTGNQYGIRLRYSDNNTIAHNTADRNGGRGIYLRYSNSNLILNNTADFNAGHMGILVSYSESNEIIGNSAAHNAWEGLRLFWSDNCIVSGNNFSENDHPDYGTGILSWSSDNAKIINNTAEHNIYGIYLHISSYNNTVTGNTLSENAYGIVIYKSNSTVMDNNTASSNDVVGIYMNAAYGSEITNNIVTDNNYGAYVRLSEDNRIYNNYFNNTNNSYCTTVYPNIWNTTKIPATNIIGNPNTGGNYWADPNGTGFSETCTDSDSDGFCDSSYTIAANNIDYLPLSDTHMLAYSLSINLYRIQNSTGLNLISLPIEHSFTTAADLCQNISNLSMITRWDQMLQQYIPHFCIIPGMNNFNLEDGQGYFITMTQNTTLTLTGPASTLPPIPLFKILDSTGLNLIGLPYDSAMTPLTAHGLCSDIDNSLMITRWDQMLQQYIPHFCTIPGMNNFDLKDGQGYFITVTENTVWMPH